MIELGEEQRITQLTGKLARSTEAEATSYFAADFRLVSTRVTFVKPNS